MADPKDKKQIGAFDAYVIDAQDREDEKYERRQNDMEDYYREARGHDDAE